VPAAGGASPARDPEDRRAPMMPSRARSQARRVGCPACRARPGERCVGVRGKPRAGCHAERWELFRTVRRGLSWSEPEEISRG
jgi:hypothetical protein